jgi:transcriptional regulator with XRE-family HTH domain
MAKIDGEHIVKVFGERLRELRRARGLSQERLALLAKVDRSYVGQAERGTRNVALVNIAKLAHALEVSPHELLLPPGSEHSIHGE